MQQHLNELLDLPKPVIAYDLDGVICVKTPNLKGLKKAEKLKEYLIHLHEAEVNPVFEQIKKIHAKTSELPFAVITGRNRKYSAITTQWFRKNNIKPSAIHFIDRARTSKNMIDFKAEKIKELGIKVYYEDDDKIARRLFKRLEGNITIHLVKPNKIETTKRVILVNEKQETEKLNDETMKELTGETDEELSKRLEDKTDGKKGN